MKEPSILLLGCGYTLKKLSKKLTQSHVLTRRTPTENAIVFDICECTPDFLDKYPGIRTIVDSIPPGEREISAYPRFIEYLKKTKIDKIIYLSTTGVTGIDDGSVVDEQTQIDPKTDQGKRRLAVEEMYRESGIKTCSLRLPAIYGPGRGIGNALKVGRYKLIANVPRWTNRIHVDDLSSVIKASIEKEGLPSIFYVADDTPALQREVVEFYCNNFNLPWPQEITLEDARTSLHHTMLSNQRIKNDFMKATLDISMQYPSFREGAETEF